LKCLEIGSDCLAILIDHVCMRQLILFDVGVLYIADSTFGLANVVSDALATLGANANRPRHRCVGADLGLEVGVYLYEHPACQVPAPFSFLCFSLPPFSCSTAPQAFSRPDRISSQAGARRCCQGWPLLQRPPPSRGPAFTAIEHGGKA